MAVRVQSEAFDLGVETARLTKGRHDVGAVASFIGIAREDNPDEGAEPVIAMTLEHYPGMTQNAIAGLVQQASDRWSLIDALVIHRYGDLAPGAQIMMVATAAPHRAAAFAAADFLMDYLKSRAPFWKKEHSRESADWVAAKQSDETALSRWS